MEFKLYCGRNPTYSWLNVQQGCWSSSLRSIMARHIPSVRHHHRWSGDTLRFAQAAPTLLIWLITLTILASISLVMILGHCRCKNCEVRASFMFSDEPVAKRPKSWRVTEDTAKYRHNKSTGNSSVHDPSWVACPVQGEDTVSDDHQHHADLHYLDTLSKCTADLHCCTRDRPAGSWVRRRIGIGRSVAQHTS